MFSTLRLAVLGVCGALAVHIAFPDRTPVTGLLLDGRDGRLMFANDGDAVQPAGDATRLLMAHLLTEAAHAPSAAHVHRLQALERAFAPPEGALTAVVSERVNDRTPWFIPPAPGEKARLAGRLNRQAAALGLNHTRFSLSGDVLSGVTTAHDLAAATRALGASDPESRDMLTLQGGAGATPGAIRHIAGLPCRLPGRGPACRNRPAEDPVVAVVMGDGVDNMDDVLALAGLTWQVVRTVAGGRDVALVHTLASGPPPQNPAPPLRIELV